MAANEPHGETPTFLEFESEAHSLVLVDITSSTGFSDADREGIATAMKHGQGIRRMRNTGYLNPALAVGKTVKGSIEAKIDSAYLISLTVGGEKLRGVLYHVPPKRDVKQFARVSAPLLELQAVDIKSKNTGSLRRRRRKLITKDRNAPKKNRTGYNYFFAEERLRLKETCPNVRTEREISQTIAEAWNGLSQKRREPYQELGFRDAERYRGEMCDYVFQRACKTKAVSGDTNLKADGGVSLQEDRSTPLTLDMLSFEKQQVDDGVPTEEKGSNPLPDDTRSSEKLWPAPESSLAIDGA